MSRIILPYGFQLRHFQREVFKAHFIDGIRNIIQVNHRRSGKTKGAINFVTAAAMCRVGVYFHIFPELTQARRVIWQGIDSEGRRYLDDIPSELVSGINNTEMRIDFINGSTLFLAGGDRYNSLMGSNPVGIILDEYSLMNPLTLHYLSPILTENGGWLYIPFTPRGANHAYELYAKNLNNPDWFVQKMDVTQTFREDGVTPIVTLDDIQRRRDSGTPEELIQQEYFCSFEVALAGAFYSRAIETMVKENRICDFEINRNQVAFTAWDIGRRDPSAIWVFQPRGRDIDIIGYYENQFEDMEHYIKAVRKISQELGVRIDPYNNLAPHDIKVVEWGSGRSRREQAASMGFYFKPVKNIPIIDGINAVRMILKTARIHKSNCQYGLNALKQYVADDQGKPKHDWASHGADAMRMLAVGYIEHMGMNIDPRQYIMERFEA